MLIKSVFILICLVICGHSYPYGSDSSLKDSTSTTTSDVVGFSLGSQTSGSGRSLLNNIGSLSSYGGAYNTQNKVVEVRRVGGNQYGQTGSEYSSATNGDKTANDFQKNAARSSAIDDQNKSGRALQQGQGNPNVNTVTGLDQDAIIFPDTLQKSSPKDSYGNPVTPYTILPDEPKPQLSDRTDTLDIGHKTDVNKDSGVSLVRPPSTSPTFVIPPASSSQTTNTENLGFILPSYASGITKLETYSSGTVPERPFTSTSNKPQSVLLPPLSSGNFNYPQIQKDTPKKPTTNINNGQNYQQIQQPQQQQQPTQQQQQPSYQQQQQQPQQSRPIQSQSIPKPSNEILPPLSSSNQYSNQEKQPILQNTNTQNTNTYQSQSQNQQPRPQQQQPPQISQQVQPPHQQPLVQPRPSQQNQYQTQSQTQLTQPRPTQQISTVVTQQQNQQPQSSSTKYTGTFGGAPGLLSPFDRPVPTIAAQPSKTTQNTGQYQTQITNRPAVPAVSQQTSQIQHTVQYHQQQAQQQQPQNQQQQQQYRPNPSAPQTSLVPPATVSQSSFNSQFNSRISGTQQQSVIVQQQTASVQQPSRTHTQSVVQQQTVQNTNEKYVGGFGGPPGILSPYDNSISKKQ